MWDYMVNNKSVVNFNLEKAGYDYSLLNYNIFTTRDKSLYFKGIFLVHRKITSHCAFQLINHVVQKPLNCWWSVLSPNISFFWIIFKTSLPSITIVSSWDHPYTLVHREKTDELFVSGDPRIYSNVLMHES